MLFAVRGLTTAARAKSDLAAFSATGLTAAISFQAFLIVGGVTRLIPLTGVTLPFMSQGGSSLLASFIIVALLLRAGDEATGRERRAYRHRHPWPPSPMMQVAPPPPRRHALFTPAPVPTARHPLSSKLAYASSPARHARIRRARPRCAGQPSYSCGVRLYRRCSPSLLAISPMSRSSRPRTSRTCRPTTTPCAPLQVHPARLHHHLRWRDACRVGAAGGRHLLRVPIPTETWPRTRWATVPRSTAPPASRASMNDTLTGSNDYSSWNNAIASLAGRPSPATPRSSPSTRAFSRPPSRRLGL